MSYKRQACGFFFGCWAACSTASADVWPTWETHDYESLIGCGQTDLLHSNLSIRFAGEDPNSAEAGDRRILYWMLKDLDGEIVGSFDVLSTVMGRTDETGDIVHAEGLLTLGNGEIFIDGVVPLQDASDTSRSGKDEQIFELKISGGTGEFLNSSGTVSITVPKQEEEHLQNRPITLRIEC